MKSLLLVACAACAAPRAPIVAPEQVASARVARADHVDWRYQGGTPEADMLRLINAYRAAAGLAPVTLDPALSKGCNEHAHYLVLNRGKPELYSTRAHTQVPSLPGATPDGADCGAHANLYQGVDDLQTAVHAFMASLFHRTALLSPTLTKVGIGTEKYQPNSPRMAVALRFEFGGNGEYPAVYPGDGQRDVVTDFVREDPNPIPPPTIFAGNPITFNFPSNDLPSGPTATLVDHAGTQVPFWLSTPDQPASEYANQGGLIGLIPKTPLRASERYTATLHVTWHGEAKTYTTSFTTIARREIAAEDEAALIETAGLPVRVRGKILSIGSPNPGMRFVTLYQHLGGRVNEVLAEVPPAILGALKVGDVVELDGTAKFLTNEIRLYVVAAGDIRRAK